MKILIACEESQRVCIAFRNKGHEAYSCDILPCSGGHPEWHIQGDVLPILQQKWDMIIAHPPCTYLSLAGNRWFDESKYGDKARNRKILREEAMEFFMKFVDVSCKKVCIENPLGTINTRYRKPDQIIQPYMFGHTDRKATGLWLKGLPKLIATNVVEPKIIQYKNGKGTDSEWHIKTLNLPAKERSIARSKTFQGIADAMAEQWG
jgi:site-specific DNA-cytosine methylase